MFLLCANIYLFFGKNGVTCPFIDKKGVCNHPKMAPRVYDVESDYTLWIRNILRTMRQRHVARCNRRAQQQLPIYFSD